MYSVPYMDCGGMKVNRKKTAEMCSRMCDSVGGIPTNAFDLGILSFQVFLPILAHDSVFLPLDDLNKLDILQIFSLYMIHTAIVVLQNKYFRFAYNVMIESIVWLSTVSCPCT